MNIFSDKKEILEGCNAGGGKTQKIREQVRNAAPRHVFLVNGKWEPPFPLFQLASATTIDVKYIREDLAAQDLLYKLARHIRNTDEIHPATWGAQGLELLAELRGIDPEKYDKEVK